MVARFAIMPHLGYRIAPPNKLLKKVEPLSDDTEVDGKTWLELKKDVMALSFPEFVKSKYNELPPD